MNAKIEKIDQEIEKTENRIKQLQDKLTELRQKRDELEKYLKEHNIGTNKHYPTPIHLQGAYAALGMKKGELPLAEEISETELSLPMYYGMTEQQISQVIEVLNEW